MNDCPIIAVKEARQKLGLTQKQLANFLGTSQHRISEFERGKREPTKQMQHHLVALVVLYQHGLIDELSTEIGGI